MISITLVINSFNKGKRVVFQARKQSSSSEEMLSSNKFKCNPSPEINANDSEIFGSSRMSFSDFFIPKSTSMYNKIFDMEIENVRFISFPIELTHKEKIKLKFKRFTKSKKKQLEKVQNMNLYKLRAFSLVCAYVITEHSQKIGSDDNYCNENDFEYYCNELKNYSYFFEYYEYLNGFLEKQCKKIFAIREKLEQQGLSDDEVDKIVLEDNELAQRINSMLSELNPRLIKTFNFEQEHFIKPNQSFILFNPEETFNMLSPDSSKLLIKVLILMTPLKSFKELSLETDITLDEIMLCVKHLLYWNQGKIIYPIRVDNIYRVSNTAVIDKEASMKFSNFVNKNRIKPRLALNEFVIIFSMTQKEKDKIKSRFTSQKDLYEIIAYFLRNNILCEHFYYYYLVYPLKNEIEAKELLKKKKIKGGYNFLQERRKTCYAHPKSMMHHMIKKRSSSIGCSNRLDRDFKPVPSSGFSDLSDQEDEGSSSEESIDKEVSFEEYIEKRETNEKHKDKLLKIAPLLRRSCFNIIDIANIIQESADKLKNFLDMYPDCIVSILHE